MDLLGKSLPPPQPFLQSSEFRRIVVLGVFGVFFTIFIAGQFLGPDEPAPRPAALDLPAGNTAGPPPTPIAAEFEGFREVKDQAGIELGPAFFKALETVAKLDPAATVRQIDRTLIHRDLMKFPAQCRTKFIRVEGLLIKLFPYPSKLLANPAGVPEVYEAMIADLASDEAYCVHFLEKPDPPLEAEIDRVSVDGMFYQVYRFQNEKGGQRDVPLLIARRLTRLPPLKYEAKNQFTVVVLGVTGLMLLVVVGMGIWNAQRDRDFHRRMKIMREKLASPPAAGGTDGTR